MIKQTSNNKLSYILTSYGRIKYFYTSTPDINMTSEVVETFEKSTTIHRRREYYLTDHLGNVRVVFCKQLSTNNAILLQQTHYYAHGLEIASLGNTNIEHSNLYNGKELQDEAGLDYLNYGWRQLDPQLGVWHCVDKLAAMYPGESPYSYAGNNPVSAIDIMGLTRTYANGEWTGNRGCDNLGYSNNERPMFESPVQAGGSGVFDCMADSYDWSSGTVDKDKYGGSYLNYQHSLNKQREDKKTYKIGKPYIWIKTTKDLIGVPTEINGEPVVGATEVISSKLYLGDFLDDAGKLLSDGGDFFNRKDVQALSFPNDMIGLSVELSKNYNPASAIRRGMSLSRAAAAVASELSVLKIFKYIGLSSSAIGATGDIVVELDAIYKLTLKLDSGTWQTGDVAKVIGCHIQTSLNFSPIAGQIVGLGLSITDFAGFNDAFYQSLNKK